MPSGRLFTRAYIVNAFKGKTMTRQIDDLLLIDGGQYRLRGWPLEDWFAANPRPNFLSIGTNCWRGYRAIWAVLDGRLYLTSVGTGSRCREESEGRSVIELFFDERLGDVFPNYEAPVAADWVSDSFYAETARRENRTARNLVIDAGRVVSVCECPVSDPWANRRKRLQAILG